MEITKGATTIDWEPPDNDGGAEITHYVLEVRRPAMILRGSTHVYYRLVVDRPNSTIYHVKSQ